MFKIKKLLSAVLAGAMLLSMSITASAVGDFVPTANGTYTADMVEALNYYTPANYSMCNGVFAAEADVTIDGDWATLHLYVCNPTPGTWGGLETGILSEAYITYSGTQYTGTLTSIGYENDDAAVKLFTQDSSFFGITADAYNPCDTMEFTIPTAALASNIELSTWVNLVMNSRQSFWLDINWDANSYVAPDSDNSDTVPYGDYTMEVNYWKTNADETSSMASYMASTTVPVTVDANGYTLALDFHNYWAADGSTALRDLQVDVNGNWANLDMIDVSAEYDGGPYERAFITVDSLEDIILQAYIIPMPASYAVQSWRVVSDASTLTPVVAGTSQSMTVTATVAKNVSTSTVTIPESTNMGTLSKSEDTVVSYRVSVVEGYGQTVEVTADETVTLTSGAAALTIANDFDGVNGTLTATATDVAAVATYEDMNFSGALTFSINIT